MGSAKDFRHLTLYLTIIFLFSLVHYAFAKEKEIEDQGIHDVNGKQIIVYYFYGGKRCTTCKKIEQFTREAVETFFKNQIDSGLVKFSVVNVDESKNAHFTKDYQLFTKSVVISHIQNGKETQWKNLQKVWELVHNEEGFKEYIRNEIKAYIS